MTIQKLLTTEIATGKIIEFTDLDSKIGRSKEYKTTKQQKQHNMNVTFALLNQGK